MRTPARRGHTRRGRTGPNAGERLRATARWLVVASIALFLGGCEQPQHEDYLTDIRLHVLALRSAVSRAQPSYETMLVDAHHIEASARELRTSYPDDPERARVMQLQLHASELTMATAAQDAVKVEEAIEAIERAANELQGMK